MEEKKNYKKPSIEEEILELSDIIAESNPKTDSNVFSGGWIPLEEV